MKRLYAVLSLILLVTALAFPTIARADGWTWDESSATQPADTTPAPDGWTWDEA
jgi:hypothetical protein